MLSPHLADLYQVEPRVLVQAVKRNIERFPDDFMFQLSDAGFEDLKSQIVISSWGGLCRIARTCSCTEHCRRLTLNLNRNTFNACSGA